MARTPVLWKLGLEGSDVAFMPGNVIQPPLNRLGIDFGVARMLTLGSDPAPVLLDHLAMPLDLFANVLVPAHTSMVTYMLLSVNRLPANPE